MDSLQIKAVLAGIFFGIWPLLMNRSGLSGNVSTVCLSLMIIILVSPLALYSNGLTIPTANWAMVVLASLFGATGLIFFNGMLANALPQNVGTLFVLMTTAQIVVAASYQVVMNGTITIDKIGGYIAAGIATYLLLR